MHNCRDSKKPSLIASSTGATRSKQSAIGDSVVVSRLKNTKPATSNHITPIVQSNQQQSIHLVQISKGGLSIPQQQQQQHQQQPLHHQFSNPQQLQQQQQQHHPQQQIQQQQYNPVYESASQKPYEHHPMQQNFAQGPSNKPLGQQQYQPNIVLKEHSQNMNGISQTRPPPTNPQLGVNINWKQHSIDSKQATPKYNQHDNGTFESQLQQWERLLRQDKPTQIQQQQQQQSVQLPIQSIVQKQSPVTNPILQNEQNIGLASTTSTTSTKNQQQNRRHQRHNSEITISSTMLALQQANGFQAQHMLLTNKENAASTYQRLDSRIPDRQQPLVINPSTTTTTPTSSSAATPTIMSANQVDQLLKQHAFAEKQMKAVYHNGFSTLPQTSTNSVSHNILNEFNSRMQEDQVKQQKDRLGQKVSHSRQSSVSILPSQSSHSQYGSVWGNQQPDQQEIDYLQGGAQNRRAYQIQPIITDQQFASYSRSEKPTSVEKFSAASTTLPKSQQNPSLMDFNDDQYKRWVEVPNNTRILPQTTSNLMNNKQSNLLLSNQFGTLPRNPQLLSQQSYEIEFNQVSTARSQAQQHHQNLLNLASAHNNHTSDPKGFHKRRNDSYEVSPNQSILAPTSSPGRQATRIQSKQITQQLNNNTIQPQQSLNSYPIQPTFAQQLRIEKERKSRVAESKVIAPESSQTKQIQPSHVQQQQSTAISIPQMPSSLPPPPPLEQQQQQYSLNDLTSINGSSSNCNSGTSLKKTSLKPTSSNSNYTGSTTHTSTSYTPFSADTTALYLPLRDEYSPYANNFTLPNNQQIKHARRPSNPLALLPLDQRSSEAIKPISSETLKQPLQIGSDNSKQSQSNSSPFDFGAPSKYFTLQYGNTNNLFSDQSTILSKLSDLNDQKDHRLQSQLLPSQLYSIDTQLNPNNLLNMNLLQQQQQQQQQSQPWTTNHGSNNIQINDKAIAPSSTKSWNSTATKSRTSSMHFTNTNSLFPLDMLSQPKTLKLEDVYTQTLSQITNNNSLGSHGMKPTTTIATTTSSTANVQSKQSFKPSIDSSTFFSSNTRYNESPDLHSLNFPQSTISTQQQGIPPHNMITQFKEKKEINEMNSKCAPATTTATEKPLWYLHDSQAEHLNTEKLAQSTSSNLTLVTSTFRDDDFHHRQTNNHQHHHNSNLNTNQQKAAVVTNHFRRNSTVSGITQLTDFDDLSKYLTVSNNGNIPSSHNPPTAVQTAIDFSHQATSEKLFGNSDTNLNINIPFTCVQSIQIDRMPQQLEASINLFIEQEKLLCLPRLNRSDEGDQDLDCPLIESIEDQSDNQQTEVNIRNLQLELQNQADGSNQNEDDDDLLNMGELICEEQNIKENEDRLNTNSDTLTSFLKGLQPQDQDSKNGFNAFDQNYFKNQLFDEFNPLSSQPDIDSSNLKCESDIAKQKEPWFVGQEQHQQNQNKQGRNKPEKDMKSLLDDFEQNHVRHPIFGSDHLEFLVQKDSEYAPDPHYLTATKQPNLSRSMRATLLDWMMEVSEEFRLKRETFHIAVNLVDRYLSLKLNIRKRDFQLVGVTSLYISAKLEEILPPRIGDFVCSTNNGYTAVEINSAELSILETLKFKINPPTLNMWGNWFMSQWDIFISTSDEAQESELIQSFTAHHQRLVQFKQPDEESYALFREFMQIVDITVLDISTLQFEPRQVLASIMYIVIGKALGLFNDGYVQSIPEQGIGSFYGDDDFHQLFDSFVNLSFGFPIQTIFPIIQDFAFYFQIPKDTHLPAAAANNQDSESPFQGYYEDFLAFQTHNKEQLSTLEGRI